MPTKKNTKKTNKKATAKKAAKKIVVRRIDAISDHPLASIESMVATTTSPVTPILDESGVILMTPIDPPK